MKPALWKFPLVCEQPRRLASIPGSRSLPVPPRRQDLVLSADGEAGTQEGGDSMDVHLSKGGDSEGPGSLVCCPVPGVYEEELCHGLTEK